MSATIRRRELIAALGDPASPFSRLESQEAATSARSLGLELHVANAINQYQIDASFSSLMALGARAIILGVDALFYFHRSQVAALASRYGIPSLVNGANTRQQAG